MKKVIAIIGALFGLMLTLVLVRTFMFSPPEHTQAPPLELPPTAVSQRLAASLTFPTISGDNFAAEPFRDLQSWMEKTYPRFHAVTSLRRFAGHTLLFTWPGRSPERRPVLFLAHQDVVPVEAGTVRAWTHPPFA